MNFLKIIKEKEFFPNVSLSNMKNVLQRNQRTDKARKCILGTNFGNFFIGGNHGFIFMSSMRVLVCTKKSSGYVTGSGSSFWQRR